MQCVMKPMIISEKNFVMILIIIFLLILSSILVVSGDLGQVSPSEDPQPIIKISDNVSLTKESDTTNITFAGFTKETKIDSPGIYTETYTLSSKYMITDTSDLGRVDENVALNYEEGLIKYSWNKDYLNFKPQLRFEGIDYFVGYEEVSGLYLPKLTLPIVKKDGWLKYDLNISIDGLDLDQTEFYLELVGTSMKLNNLTVHKYGYEYDKLLFTFSEKCDLLVNSAGVLMRNLTRECLDPEVYYNFTTNFSNIMAFESDAPANNTNPPPSANNPPLGWNLANVTSSTGLDKSDNAYENTAITTLLAYKEGIILFNASVDSANKNITVINWTWEGGHNTVCSGVRINTYLWNYTANNWTNFTTALLISGADRNFSAASNRTTNFMNNNLTTFLVFASDEACGSTSINLETDYVTLALTYIQLTPSFTQVVVGVNTTQQYAFAIDKLNYSVTLSTNFSSQNISIQWLNQSKIAGTNVFSRVKEHNFTCENTTCRSGEAINATDLRHFQNWTLTAYAWSGEWNSGWVNSSNITINNSKPTVTSVALTPALALDNDVLECNVQGAKDVDVDDANTTYYMWFNSSTGINYAPMTSVNTSGTLQAANTLNNAYYRCNAWINDSYELSGNVTSQSVIIGASNSAPYGISVNVTRLGTSIVSNTVNPQFNDSGVSFNVNFTEPDGDNVTVHIGRSNTWNGNNFSSYFNVSETNTSLAQLSLNNSVLGYSCGTNNFFVEVKDNNSLSSSLFSSSFEINCPPSVASPTGPSNGTLFAIGTTSVQLDFNSSDIDSDTLYYLVYGSTSSPPDQNISNTSSTSFVWTGLIDGGTYYWRVMTVDEHGYYGLNSSVRTFSIDAAQDSGGTPAVGGGGGGGTPLVFALTEEKKVCSVEVIPETVTLSTSKKLAKLTIVNNENFSISPTFNISSTTHLSIEGLSSEILPKKFQELTILFINSEGFVGEEEVDINVNFGVCETKNIKVFIVEKEEIISRLYTFFGEKIFKLSLGFIGINGVLNVTFYGLLIFIVLVTILIFSRVPNKVLSLKKKLALTILTSPFITIFAAFIIKTFVGAQ